MKTDCMRSDLSSYIFGASIVSANVGVFTLYFMCVYGSIQMVLYTIPIDLGTRQFIVSLIADLGLCIITPAIVLYNAPAIRS